MKNVYRGKKVFLTGHTGFKGSWLALWLNLLGAKVCGYSLAPNTNPSMFYELGIENKIEKSIIGDILDEKLLNSAICDFEPDIVFHLAAQPLVRTSYKEPVLTYQTNVIGTLNLLIAANNCKSTQAFVNVTTDKCYENKELEKAFSEDSPLGGYDMYSSSKACSEILSSSFRNSYLKEEGKMALATSRAGNVIAGGDWAQDRLIPDCIRAINDNKMIEIRNPNSIRPWQHVLDALYGYLLLGKKLLSEGKKFADAYNFGPDEAETLNVLDVAQNICRLYGKGQIKEDKSKHPYEAKTLILSTAKAKETLGWTPIYTNIEAIEKTVLWYKNFYEKKCNMYDFTINQIKEYEEKLSGARITK